MGWKKRKKKKNVCVKPQSRFGDTSTLVPSNLSPNRTAVLKGFRNPFYPSASSAPRARADSSYSSCWRDKSSVVTKLGHSRDTTAVVYRNAVKEQCQQTRRIAAVKLKDKKGKTSEQIAK